MYINYPRLIQESVEDLNELEQSMRGHRLVERVRMLRLLKSEQVYTAIECAELFGYSERQVLRWWDCYRTRGLEGLLEVPPPHGRPNKITEEAWGGLQAQMEEGRIDRVADAAAYLKDQWGIEYADLSFAWWQLRHHQAKLKTGHRRHQRRSDEQQAQLKKHQNVGRATGR